MFNKILNCYKKGEWLLYIAILLQSINFAIISFRYKLSGTGVFNERIINLCSCVILGIYLLIEFAFVIFDFVKNIKNKEEKYKIKIAIDIMRFVVVAIAATLAVISFVRYFSDRLNYFADYNTTHVIGAFASAVAMIGVLLKKFKNVAKSCFAGALLMVSLASMLKAFTEITVLKQSVSNNLILMVATWILLFVLLINEAELAAKIVAYISVFLGCAIMIDGYITGGIYSFLNADLFEYARLGNIVGAMMLLPSVFVFAESNFQAQRGVMRYVSLSLSAVSATLACVWAYYTIGIKMGVPADMALLEISFILYIPAYLCLFISMSLNLTNKACMWSLTGLNLAALVFGVSSMSLQRGKANQAEFYGKFYLAVYIVMMVMLLCTVITKLVIASIDRKKNKQMNLINEEK